MQQDFEADEGENRKFDRRGANDVDRYHNHDDSHRWPAEAPSVELARVVLKVDGSITLKRAAAWLTGHHHAAPALPIKPTRMELAVVIALAETYGAHLYRAAHFVPVLDFIADYGAVALVQRVMYGARPDSDNSADSDVTARTAENTRLAEVLREARVTFEFLCATWPDVFLAETHALLASLGVQVRLPDAERLPPMGAGDADCDVDADHDDGGGDDNPGRDPRRDEGRGEGEGGGRG
ncbi:hypothetical protein AWB78_08052 [Caballeronia calidae]|uniref:Uncharacterized protein n=1 Tax=Caballeronia calidae TaxID=1777139 RepID=A0A158EHY8_9BURK|nr:hypothetical protein [Caballeronia calidae]SAL06403.1 hypothetical protein AWB78_08052 [Caballeronia calidae]